MISETVHQEVLIKFDKIKGQILTGRESIKGKNKTERVLPDEYVSEQHILHDLIRGFYKPKGQPYLLSYLATESLDNYGEQIVWKDELKTEFEQIKMYPPSSEKDNRKKSDIAAARYCLNKHLPIGIIYRIKKGVYRVLGLGIITEENKDGIFIIKPHTFKSLESDSNGFFVHEEYYKKDGYENLYQTKYRIGQTYFKDKLLETKEHCDLCDIDKEYTVASHIKPWRLSNPKEKIDPHNGLLLCPNHDYLFDKGYISFDNDGKLLISERMDPAEFKKFNLSEQKCIIVNKHNRDYIYYHRTNIFNKKIPIS